ncbi:MAG: HAD family phosphatase [Desulfofustis sp.]|nr:HAD family phosphatase [Desulfofustis sp.]
MTIEALIFDMDGTLVDSERTHWLAWRQTLAADGMDIPDYAEFKKYVGVSDEQMAQEFSAAANPSLDPRNLVTRKCSTYLDLVPQIELLPGVVETLERWKGRFAMAVASSSPHRELIALLEHHGLRERFIQVVGGDMVPKKKPAPDIYQMVVALLGLTPAACVAFEDSQSGVSAAKSAGLTAVAVPHAMTLGHDFGNADVVIDSLADFDERLLHQLETLARK